MAMMQHYCSQRNKRDRKSLPLLYKLSHIYSTLDYYSLGLLFLATMAMEIAYKKFMTAASGWYKRSLAKELNKMGAF